MALLIYIIRFWINFRRKRTESKLTGAVPVKFLFGLQVNGFGTGSPGPKFLCSLFQCKCIKPVTYFIHKTILFSLTLRFIVNILLYSGDSDMPIATLWQLTGLHTSGMSSEAVLSNFHPMWRFESVLARVPSVHTGVVMRCSRQLGAAHTVDGLYSCLRLPRSKAEGGLRLF
ncbi:putative ATPase family AAA domain-containing protein 3A like protein [Fusarium oxysporum f. sp. albedinis]|nr:putative ATPase family AAA domain-containing protein 3A like protein [Fusarium oxysporum f. sp. albedinis]